MPIARRAAAAVLLVALCSMSLQGEAGAVDRDIDGVPLPADVSPLRSSKTPFEGMWIGSWDGRLKTILVIEQVNSDGKAKVVYAVGDNPGRFKRAWFRYDAKVLGNQLTVYGKLATIKFDLSRSRRLRGVLGDRLGFAVLTKPDFDLLKPIGRALPWAVGRTEFLVTEFLEQKRQVRLEAVVFKPPGNGPFPLAVVNHGSTGNGRDATAAGLTWVNPWFADILNERGWLAVFLQRRGRGKSDGVYDEGFSSDRSKGYTCDTRRSLAGAGRALEDLGAAIAILRKRPDVLARPVLLAGNSRGGVLSLAYAGKHPEEVAGAINFVGGWMGDGCGTADVINQNLFKAGGNFKGPTLWLYGRDDPYYSIAHSRQNYEAFRNSGGQGQFLEMSVAGKGNGHWVMAIPPLWSKTIEAYLDKLNSAKP